jgi:hypothetical protein
VRLDAARTSACATTGHVLIISRLLTSTLSIGLQPSEGATPNAKRRRKALFYRCAALFTLRRNVNYVGASSGILSSALCSLEMKKRREPCFYCGFCGCGRPPMDKVELTVAALTEAPPGSRTQPAFPPVDFSSLLVTCSTRLAGRQLEFGRDKAYPKWRLPV